MSPSFPGCFPIERSASPTPPFLLLQEGHAVYSTARKRETTDCQLPLSYGDHRIGLFQPKLFMFGNHLADDNDGRCPDSLLLYSRNNGIHRTQGNPLI